MSYYENYRPTRKSKQKDKKSLERQHCKRRAKERAHTDLTFQTKIKIINDIREGKLEFVERKSNRVTHWRVTIGGNNYIVSYDKNRKELITILYDYEKKERE